MFRMTDHQFNTATINAKQLTPESRQEVVDGLLQIALRCGNILGTSSDLFGDLFGCGFNPLKR